MNRADNYLPTPDEELLLGAALWHGDDALTAWQTWQSRIRLETVDPAAMRVLPLVYLNLREQTRDAAMNRLRGIHRLTWYRNQILFRRVEPTLAALRQAGIRTMLLKGAALVQHFYRDFGARPMSDFDVLVPAEQLAPTRQILARMGWRDKPIIPLFNSRAFMDDANRELDLHWHVLQECLYDGADDTFWRAAVPARLGEVETLALNPTDQLFHACVHGIRWNQLPSWRWVADGLTILNVSASSIDWARLIAHAQARELVLVALAALSYLREKMRASVPANVIERLDGLAVSQIEELDYQTRTRPPAFLGLSAYWVGYQRLVRANGLPHNPLRLWEYLRRVWDLEHWTQVPFFAFRRFVRALSPAKDET